MDVLQDYITLLSTILPPSLYIPILRVLTTTIGFFRALSVHLSPLAIRLITQPDLTSIALTLVLFFISLKILGMLYNAVMFWVRLAIRVVVLGGAVFLGMWIYNRGFDGFVADVEGLVEFWRGEYDRFSQDAKKFQTQKPARGRYY